MSRHPESKRQRIADADPRSRGRPSNREFLTGLMGGWLSEKDKQNWAESQGGKEEYEQTKRAAAWAEKREQDEAFRRAMRRAEQQQDRAIQEFTEANIRALDMPRRRDLEAQEWMEANIQAVRQGLEGQPRTFEDVGRSPISAEPEEMEEEQSASASASDAEEW